MNPLLGYFSAQTSVSDTETIIPCPALNTSWRGLIWTFNHSQTIMSHSVSDTVFEEWRRYVKDVSGTGSLTLQHLTSGLAGVYTCEISSDEETCIRDTYLSITEKHGEFGNTREFMTHREPKCERHSVYLSRSHYQSRLVSHLSMTTHLINTL